DYLAAYSFEILTARSGESGLRRAAETQPELILLDVQMPGIDGFETCRRLKANPETAGIPVIFMTVQADSQAVVRGLEAGAVDYIPKPLEAAEMLARVRTHLDLRSLQLHLEKRVAERTAALEEEIVRRKAEQAEKERLLETVRQQSEQLRSLTQLFLENQQTQQRGLAATLDDSVRQDIGLLMENLSAARRVLEMSGGDAASHLPVAHLAQAAQIVAHLQTQTETMSLHLATSASDQKKLLDNPLFKLTDREREVLQLVVAGKSNQAIAEILVVTRGTVSTYRRRLMDKLDIHDLAGLIRFALENGLAGE
ncbi:MAG: DNA-binding response regulator, partial [Caldilineaceae bacterium]